MKCPYCGAELSDHARFCKYCGKPIEKKPEKPKKNVFKVLLLFLLVCGVGAGGWYGWKRYFPHGETGKAETAAESSEESAGNETVETTVPEQEAVLPEPETMNAVIEKIKGLAAEGEYIDKVMELIRSDEYKNGIREMRKLGLDRVVSEYGDSQAVGVYFADEQYVVYIGGYNRDTGTREGYGDWIGADVVFADIPYRDYAGSGNWTNDMPEGQWTVNSYVRTSADSGYNRQETGSVSQGLWQGTVRITEGASEYSFDYENGKVHVYESFYNDGYKYSIVQYTNTGYIYIDGDVADDLQGIAGYASGN